ncbi:MAG: hypothetical protein CM15mP83_6920 [Flavobacteriaceae bacterium]|nr:MAG: hypothetical protein CM15mP83_6920 [Flavobacteriaceae bacterium]
MLALLNLQLTHWHLKGVLNIGEVAEYRASYQIQQEAVDGGGISNTFTATYNGEAFTSDDASKLQSPQKINSSHN